MRIFGLFIFLSLLACVHDPLVPPGTNPDPDPDVPCDPNLINFQEQVLPIFLSNCAQSGCHGGTNPQEGIRLDNYANIRNTGGLDFNRPERSKILKDGILEDDPDKIMPPRPRTPLSQAQINTIINWIAQGAKDTSCRSAACDTISVNYTNQVQSVLSKYCVACHNAQNPSGNVQLHTYSLARTLAINGRLSGVVEHKPGFVPMPLGGSKLPDCAVRQIQIWVANGAPQ